VQRSWSSSSSGKSGGSHNPIALLGDSPGHYQDRTCLPKDKSQKMCNLVRAWLTKKKATKGEILSLLGLLQHAIQVVRCGKPFLSRMYATAAKIKEPHYYTHLIKNLHSDLH